MSNDRKSKDITKLQGVILDMDSLSQEGFSEIAAVAKLTITAIESGTCVNPMGDILSVLRLIWGKAADIENCINCEAEDVGCNYTSESTRREIKEVMEVSGHE